MNSKRKPTAIVDVYDLDKSRGKIIGITFTLDYEGGTARVSVPVSPPLSGELLPDALRPQFRQIAEALLEVEQAPQRILWHHQELK
jgi:hypothetical protein